ncbi:MAG: hypothetical protein CME63_08540 [Halobacteriovoraceae bacterium]|nr:hypothetical protein [Halobacteriovoraceae bacterium]
MKLKSLFLMTGLILSAQLQAFECRERLAQTVEESDIFYKERVMKKGKYKGECVYNFYRRNSPVFQKSLMKEDQREELEKKYGIQLDSRKVYFGNFRHGGKYYLAEYTPGSIKDSLLMFEKFIEPVHNVVLTGHTQLRFFLKEPIKLYHPKLPAQEVVDFTYAMFAAKPESIKSETFSPFGDGVKKNYVITHNFMSIEDMAIEYKDYVKEGSTHVSQHKLESFGLDFEKAFYALLSASHRAYYGELDVYNTLTNNCVSNMYIGIIAGDKGMRKINHDQLTHRSVEAFGHNFISPKNPHKKKVKNPMWVFRDLSHRGMIQGRDESEVIDFNREISEILGLSN